MAALFSQPLLKIYRAPMLSCSYIFCFSLFLTAIVLPFFLAFSTYTFWDKQENYTEQPKVLYRKELIAMVYSEAETVSGSTITKTPSLQVFSTIGSINSIYFENLHPMQIASSSIDLNFDGKPDIYEFNVTSFTNPAHVRNVKIVTCYDYQIRDKIKMDLIGLAWADINTPVGASFIYIDGELNFKQTAPLKTSTIVRDEYNSSIISLESAAENYLPLMLMRYNERNFTTEHNYQKMVLPKGGSDCVISIRVRIPANEMYQYTPGFLEAMKYAWVQYISLLIPVAYGIYRFAGFLYRNQILESHVTYEKQ